MDVFATVGLAGSGKSEAARVAAELGVPVVTMGDVIREACRERGLDPAEHHGQVAQALREEGGPAAVAERTLPRVRDLLADHDRVLIDGVRSDVEVDRFEAAFGEGFTLVSVEAPRAVRAKRVAARGRDASADDGGESLAERDERELGFGMGAAMDRADVVVENTASLEAFRERVRTLFEDGPAALAGDEHVTVRTADPGGTGDGTGDGDGDSGGEREREGESEDGNADGTEPEVDGR